MEINQEIIEILKEIEKIKKPNIKKYLKKEKNNIKIKSSEDELFSITPNSLYVLKTKNLQEKIILKKEIKNNTLKQEKIKRFLKNISKRIIRLNHVGIGYNCKNPKKEIKKYFPQINYSQFNLYEEISDNQYVNWYYLGNLKEIQCPLF
jgi:hypothetical protein